MVGKWQPCGHFLRRIASWWMRFTTMPSSMEEHPTVLRAFALNMAIINTVPSHSIRMETRSKP